MDPLAILDEHRAVIDRLAPLVPEIQRVASRMIECLGNGGTIFWMGNGGSAADSQHLAAEFVGRFERERRGWPSIALTTDTSVLTAIGNDYGYDRVFERQVEALCRPGDVVVGISTSGRSPNVLAGLRRAREREGFVVGLTGGTGGSMPALCDACFIVPSQRAARIQEAHILIGHILCDLVEEARAQEDGGDAGAR